MKEYQDGFLRDVFVDVLGYTYKYDGNETFNLLREKKNVKRWAFKGRRSILCNLKTQKN